MGIAGVEDSNVGRRVPFFLLLSGLLSCVGFPLFLVPLSSGPSELEGLKFLQLASTSKIRV